MINNKKGFTLIEILMVIAVMGLVGVMVTVSLTSSLKNINQRKCDDFVTEIEEAACVYTNLSNKEVICTRTNCPPVSLKILVEQGQIKSEKDACTNSDIDLTQTVTISWDSNGEKKCHYNGVRKYAE